MKTLKYIPLISIYLFCSCINTLEIDTKLEEKVLVVEGHITTAPGPYTIRLTKSAKYGSVLNSFVKPEVGADVWITDEKGNVISLQDYNYGLYRTPEGFQGKIGKTYILHIELANGEEYASIPETIQPVPDISSVYFNFRKIPTSDPLVFTTGVEVFVTFLDPANESNNYLWRQTGVYQIETYPENYVAPGPFPGVPAPKACCKECWVSERNDFNFSVRSDTRTNGMINTHQVTFIKDNGLRFMNKYRISIEQLSISKEAFHFLNLMKNQQSINGDIFDPPPATIRGNIINLKVPDANVIGYFFASDIKEARIYVNSQDLPELQPKVIINDDCRLQTGASRFRPSDWD